MTRIIVLEIIALWIAVYTGSYGRWLIKQGRKFAGWVVYGAGLLVLLAPVMARMLGESIG